MKERNLVNKFIVLSVLAHTKVRILNHNIVGFIVAQLVIWFTVQKLRSKGWKSDKR